MNRHCLALVVFLVSAASLLADEQLILTGVVDSLAYRRAFFRSLPGGEIFSLSPGEERAGLSLVKLDRGAKRVILRRGTNEWSLDFPGAAGAGTVTGGSRASEPAPPDHVGPWPEGYEPEIIRRHRAGLLGTNTATPGVPGQATASAQYVQVIRDYARQLPLDERVAFRDELNRFAAPALGADNPVTPPVTAGRPGSESADAELIGQLRARYRESTDPDERRQIREQLTNFTSPGAN